MTEKAVEDDVDIWKAAIMVKSESTRIDEICEENSGFVYVTMNEFFS